MGPLLIDEQDLSVAWAKAVLHVVANAGLEISPLILSVTGSTTLVSHQKRLRFGGARYPARCKGHALR